MVSVTWSLSSVLAVLPFNWLEGRFWDSSVLCPFGRILFNSVPLTASPGKSESTNGKRTTSPVLVLVRVTMPLTYASPNKGIKICDCDGFRIDGIEGCRTKHMVCPTKRWRATRDRNRNNQHDTNEKKRAVDNTPKPNYVLSHSDCELENLH
jgi:hypothetical protein